MEDYDMYNFSCEMKASLSHPFSSIPHLRLSMQNEIYASLLYLESWMALDGGDLGWISLYVKSRTSLSRKGDEVNFVSRGKSVVPWQV